MAQFDVCELRSSPGSFVVVLQSDLTITLGTRVVAPLFPGPGVPAMSQLHVAVVFNGNAFLVQIDRLATIPIKALAPPSGTLIDYEERLKRSLDFLFFGI